MSCRATSAFSSSSVVGSRLSPLRTPEPLRLPRELGLEGRDALRLLPDLDRGLAVLAFELGQSRERGLLLRPQGLRVLPTPIPSTDTPAFLE